MTTDDHVRDSVKQITDDSWLIGSVHVLCYVQGPSGSDDDCLWKYTRDGSTYTLSTAPAPLPDTSSLPSDGHFRLIPGKRLDEAWWDMTDQEKEHVVNRVADICLELLTFGSDVMTETDDGWIDPFREALDAPSAQALQKQCEDLEMDCSTFVLSHNDLGPTNIVIDNKRITVLDWEMAGYVSLEWVRTKFAVCGAMLAQRVGSTGVVETDGEYRKRVERRLGERGLPEVTEAYRRMAQARRWEWYKRRPWIK
ncbi:hypothetical protein GE09DRAFT_1163633 [Coniochaeta sp. 2T2.1]|nr:hypothetical protein GE09DRAFT_1163633 [Coniochaeta sp. 2T2.1]